MLEKTCRLCGSVKPLDEFCRLQSGTYENRCKECRKPYARKYYDANATALRQASRQWQINNTERVATRKREYAIANKEQEDARKRAWSARPENRKQTAERARQARAITKREVFAHYGGAVCTCCGETEIHLLSLDHIDGAGSQHRRDTVKGGGEKMYRWARTNGYPLIFQVLCLACNQGKHINGGICPHQEAISIIGLALNLTELREVA